MPYRTLNKSFISLFLIFISLSTLAQSDGEAANTSTYAGTWLSIMPPLLAIAIALLFRQVIPALFIGLIFGVWVIGGLDWVAFFKAPLQTVEVFTVKALADAGHASIIVFSLVAWWASSHATAACKAW